MRHVFAFLIVFVLFSVITPDGVSASPLKSWDIKTEFALLPDPPMFSTDVDLFLGQKKRRRSGGGRVWANLYYGDTTLRPSGGGKIDPSFYGFHLGVDLTGTHGTHSSFFFNFNQSKTKFGGATSAIDNYLVGYGKFIYLQFCHFALTGSVGYDQYEVAAGKIAATGDGMQASFFGEFGLDFIFGRWGIKPYYALQYDFLYHGRIGNSPNVLREDWNEHGLDQLFGLRLNWKALDWLELQGRTTWIHDMLDNHPPFYRGRFSPVPSTHTPVMMFYEGNIGRDWAWLGIGAKFEGVFNVYLFGDYDVLLNKRHTTHIGSFGLCFGW